MGTWIDLFIVIYYRKSCDTFARFFLFTVKPITWFYAIDLTLKLYAIKTPETTILFGDSLIITISKSKRV